MPAGIAQAFHYHQVFYIRTGPVNYPFQGDIGEGCQNGHCKQLHDDLPVPELQEEKNCSNKGGNYISVKIPGIGNVLEDLGELGCAERDHKISDRTIIVFQCPSCKTVGKFNEKIKPKYEDNQGGEYQNVK